MEFKSLPDNEKPRERLKLYGSSYLSNEELLEIIISSGNRKYSVKDIANNILREIKDISNLKNINLTRLKNIEGMSEIKALELVAIIEIGKRIYRKNEKDLNISFTDPLYIVEYFNDYYKEKRQEEFFVIYLDNKKKYIAKKMLFKGSINGSLVHPREVFKEAYLLSASFIICLHNHPSGDATPSAEDFNVTVKLKEIGLLHGIPLIDHIVIGNNNYYSFYQDGKL